MVITLGSNDSMKARSALAAGVKINNCNCERLKTGRKKERKNPVTVLSDETEILQ